MVYSKMYSGIVPIALIVTLGVIATMLFLYTSRIIKVGHRFRAILTTLFFSSFLISIIVFISSFFTNALTAIFWGNGPIGIGFSIIFVLISAFYLVIDFDNITNAVNNRCDKSYEWILAFGLVVTILILFVRILSLLARIFSNQD